MQKVNVSAKENLQKIPKNKVFLHRHINNINPLGNKQNQTERIAIFGFFKYTDANMIKYASNIFMRSLL